MRAIDPWVNVNMGEQSPPEWLVRVKEDYFRGGDEFFRNLSPQELLADMDAVGVEKAILSIDVAEPSKHVLAFAAAAPERIALCRLDTDWYASTRHEMGHLFPRIVPGGVLLVDDYGHFMGAKQAVDEHLAAHGPEVLLQRIDFTGRLVIVPGR